MHRILGLFTSGSPKLTASYESLPCDTPKEDSFVEPIAPKARGRYTVPLLSVALAFSLSALTWVLISPFVIHQQRSEGLERQTYDAVVHREAVAGWQSSHRDAAVRSLYGMGEYENQTWLDHINNLQDDRLAPLTKWAQGYLYQHQYRTPEECAKAKYFVWEGSPGEPIGHGLGSVAHEGCWQFGQAIDSGRIFLYGANSFGSDFVDEECLDLNGLRTMNCIFEPVSNCGFQYLNEENTLWSNHSMEIWYANKEHTPAIFKQALDEHLPVDMAMWAKKYWWRAQGSTFLLRLNAESRASLRQLRLDPALQDGFTLPRNQQELQKVDMPFPLPRGTISMHVRHGDKVKDTKGLAFEDYVEKAEWLAQTSPYSLLKMAFISTEDSVVLDKARKTSFRNPTDTMPNLDWVWYTSNIDRENTGPFRQLWEFGRRKMTLMWMLQLYMAIECDAYVGSRFSNWNQLIDQARCVWLDKCDAPWVELLPESYWGRYYWR